MKSLESSTANQGFRNANSFAFRLMSTPEAPRGCRLARSRDVGLQNANSFAFRLMSTLELREGCRLARSRDVGLQNANSFAFRLMSTLELREGADSDEAAMFKPNTNQSQQFGSSGRHTAAEHTSALRGCRLPRSRYADSKGANSFASLRLSHGEQSLAPQGISWFPINEKSSIGKLRLLPFYARKIQLPCCSNKTQSLEQEDSVDSVSELWSFTQAYGIKVHCFYRLLNSCVFF